MDKLKIVFLTLFVLLFCISSVSAENIGVSDINQTVSSSVFNDKIVKCDAISNVNNATLLKSNLDEKVYTSSQSNVLKENSEVIIVENWDDLQYYCSLDDKDYVLKLKENTNFYPTNPEDSSYQIIINNNVKIIGSEGSYIGDVSPQAANITYTAFKVNDDSGIGITIDNVVFKWISTRYQPDGVFMVMGGNVNNIIRNCQFTNISTNLGHSSIVQIKKGNANLTNCTFTNCTTDFGCLSVYCPDDDPTGTCTSASMEVTDCYFEGNYARTEPGCINNCGILIVNNSTFYKNSAFWWAGAIHTHGGANTTIYDSDFIDNVAGWNGGALYTYSYLQIYNTNFIGNNCTTNNGGGAIGACKYLHAPYIYIDGCLFKNNENLCWGLDELSTTGTGRGGAISFMDEGSLEVYNNIFIQNSASIGTAICAISGGLSYGSPDVKIIGNQFINHTRVGDALDVRVAAGSVAEIRDNYFLNNSIVYSKLKLTADDPINGKVTFHLDAVLKNPKSYDADILEKSAYDVYVDGVYRTTVSTQDFTLDLGKGNTARVYVVPSISNSKSNEVFAGIAKTFIYVSQSRGNDNNNGLTRSQPVKTLNKSIELARNHENIIIMDGTFKETDLVIDYNLTISGENNVVISVTGYGFKITDGDVKFSNIDFKNSKQKSSSGERIIKQTSKGYLTLEDCTFEKNAYGCLVEVAGTLEGENLKFLNNVKAGAIKGDLLNLKSCQFINNEVPTATDALVLASTKNAKLQLEDLTFINNIVKYGCIHVRGTGVISECTFIGNSPNSNGRASSVYTEGSSLIISSSKFINNTDTGKYSSPIYVSGKLIIKDSILLNNSIENTNMYIINGGTSGIKVLTADNNWWGNTKENLIKPNLPITQKSVTNKYNDPTSYFLILNATTLDNEIELYNRVPVQFMFTQIYNQTNITNYDGVFIPSFDLNLKAVNGTCSDEKVTVVNGMALTYFTLTEKSGGSLTASFNGISTSIDFKFKKSVPTVTISSDDINVGDTAEITVDLGVGVNGNVILKVANSTQTKYVYSSGTFTISDLPAGNYTIEANYTGSERYESVISKSNLTVNKLQSDINISVGTIVLGNDVVLTFKVSEGATGNITVSLNNKIETINVGDTYTILKISRGDYIVKATYNGDEKYLPSSDEVKFEVAKFTPTITADIPDITYGNDTVVTVNLNSDATGEVSVTVDGKTNSSVINNAQAVITIPNVNAGSNKKVEIFYSGDNNYKNATISKTFNVNKAKLDFTISSNNVKLGQDAVVQIRLPARVGGSITITGIKKEVKNVPASGLITLTYANLAVGDYTINVRYDGDNYQTISNSASFKVSSWNEPQWPGEGGDISHTGKSSYDSDVNGEVKWTSQTDEISGNLAIDYEGNIYVTTVNGIFSFDKNGNLRWSYKSDAAGVGFLGISISRDVIIAPKSEDTIYFINQTTGDIYGHANLYQASSKFAPIVDSMGNAYVSGETAGGNNLVVIPYKLWQNGGAPTLISLASEITSQPVLVNDNIIAVSCMDGIKIVDTSSKTITSSISGVINNGCIAVGDGNIIYAFLDDSIVALYENGAILWKTKVTGGVGTHLALDSEQAIYSVNALGQLYKYDIIDGSESKLTNLTLTSNVLIGNDGILYFGVGNEFYSSDGDGNILWKAKLSGEITGTPIMDSNGNIYVNGPDRIYSLTNAPIKDAGLSVKTKTINIGENEIITVTLNENATGIVEININGNTSTEEITDGKIIKSISNLAAGDYIVKVKYSGDLRYSSSSKSSEFTVNKLDPKMNSTVKNIKYGEDAKFIITLPEDSNGTVSVKVNGKSNSTKVKAGKASVIISGLIKGSYNYTITFSGNDKYSNSTTSGIISVDKTDFKFNVKVDSIKVGDSAIFNITDIPKDASGKISVTVAGITNSSQVNGGKASVVINGLLENQYEAEVSYVSDDGYMADSVKVPFNVIKNDIDFSAKIPDIHVGDTAQITVNGLPSDAKGNITVIIDKISNQTNLNNGKVTVAINGLISGNKTATIIYSGDEKYNSKSITKSFKVSKIDPSLAIEDIANKYVSDSVEFKIHLYPDAFGNITLMINGDVITSDSFENGIKDFKINSLTYGEKNVVISYSGNYKYLAKNITSSFFVDKVKFQLTVNSPDSINVGDDIKFTIDLPNDAAGEVVINIDGVSKTFKRNSNFVVSDLTLGNKTAIISYSGDSKYYPSNATRNFTVNRIKPEFDVSVKNINLGENLTVNILSNQLINTTLTVSINNKEYSVKVINGIAAPLVIQNLNKGDYSYTISKPQDEIYESFSYNGFVSVGKTSVDFEVKSPENISVGSPLIFEITGLPNDASGNVHVIIGNYSNFTKVNKGKASLSISGLKSGSYVANIYYSDDENYMSDSKIIKINVNRIPSSIDVNVEDIYVGDDAIFNVDMGCNASGIISVKVDDLTVSGKLADGKVVILISNLTNGNKSATVSFSGDDKYLPADVVKKFAVNKIKPEIKVSSDDIVIGDVAVFDVELNSDAAGLITIEIDDKFNSSNLVKGKTKLYVEGLTSGIKEAVIKYIGSNRYLPISESVNLSVNKLIAPISVIVNDIDYGQTAIVNVALPEDADGNLKLVIDGITYQQEVNGKNTIFSIHDLVAGEKTFSIAYSGDGKYLDNYTNAKFMVNKIVPQINVDIEVIYVGEDAIVVVNVPDDASGSVVIRLNGVNYTADIIDSKAEVRIPDLASGNHSVLILYSGDGKYKPGSLEDIIRVLNRIKPEINIAIPKNIKLGDEFNIEVDIPKATGKVSIYIDGVEHVVKLTNGKASYPVSAKVGAHEIKVKYGGDEKYGSASASASFKVDPLKSDINEIIIAEDLTVYAVLKDERGNVVSNQPITYLIDKKLNKVTTDKNGQFSIKAHDDSEIEISYAGNENLTSTNKFIKLNNLTATKDNSNINLTMGMSLSCYAVDFGAGERGTQFKFQLTDSNGKPIRNAVIQFAYKTVYFNRTTDDNGIVLIGISTQISGEYLCALSYLGDDEHSSIFVAANIVVNKKPITIDAGAKTFKSNIKTKQYTVTLKTYKCSSIDGKTYLKKGKVVTLKINGKTFTAKTDANGKATFKITKFTKKGIYDAKINFAGDLTYNSANKKVKITIS